MSHRLWFITAKGYRANSTKGKTYGLNSGGNDAGASTSPPPVKSHRMLLIPTRMSCDNSCLPWKFSGNSVPIVFIGAPSTSHVLKFQVLRRKAGGLYKPYSLYKQFRHS